MQFNLADLMEANVDAFPDRLAVVSGESRFSYGEFDARATRLANHWTAQGIKAEDIPVVAFSVGEEELRGIDTEPLVGHLAAWNYFQSVSAKTNRDFVKSFKQYCKANNLPGGLKRVTDDPILWAYTGVYLWKGAVEKAKSFAVDKVRPALYGLSYDSPGGTVMMDERNHHLHKPVYIGEIKKNGQFKIVYESEGLVSPDSYSSYLHPDGNFPAPTGGPKKK